MNIEPLYTSRSMTMAKAKKRKAKKRGSVNRAERVQATPETLAKLRPCPLKAMLEAGTMEPQHYEAALEIWDAHDALVRHIKAKGSDFNERSDKAHLNASTRMDQLVTVYLDWSREIMRRYILQASAVVGWIDDHDPSCRLVNNVQRGILVKACDTWIDVMGDMRKAARVDRGRLAA